MIRINLLPFRAARTKENIRRQVSIFLLSFVLATIILSYCNSILSGKIKTLNSCIASLNKEVNIYRKKAQEVDRIKKNLDIMRKKLDVINNLERNRKEPVVMMETFSDVLIPQRMWLIDIQCRNNVVNLKGVALDNKTVADFMTNLEKTPIFSGVSLKTLKQKKMQKSMNLKSFEIACNLISLDEVEKNKAKTK